MSARKNRQPKHTTTLTRTARECAERILGDARTLREHDPYVLVALIDLLIVGVDKMPRRKAMRLVRERTHKLKVEAVKESLDHSFEVSSRVDVEVA